MRRRCDINTAREGCCLRPHRLFVCLLLCLCLALTGCGGRLGAESETEGGGRLEVGLYTVREDLAPSAEGAALLEAETGTLLMARGADKPLPMASTTKIMTAAVVLLYGDLTASFAIPKEAVGVEGSSLYLSEGEVFTVEELLYGLMLESGNDAAVALAIAVAGSVEGFVALMNATALSLGLESTRFANPHGLSAEGHYTTAAELARLTAYALGIEGFEEIVSTRSMELKGEGHERRYLFNHNKLLGGYDGMIGVKTGYTAAAGKCLVTAARRGDMTLVAVTLNDRQDKADHRAMLDYGFGSFRKVAAVSYGESVAVPVTGGRQGAVIATAREELWLCLPTDLSVEKIYDIRAAEAPVKQGQTVAYIKLFAQGSLVAEVPLYAAESVKKQKRLLFF